MLIEADLEELEPVSSSMRNAKVGSAQSAMPPLVRGNHTPSPASAYADIAAGLDELEPIGKKLTEEEMEEHEQRKREDSNYQEKERNAARKAWTQNQLNLDRERQLRQPKKTSSVANAPTRSYDIDAGLDALEPIACDTCEEKPKRKGKPRLAQEPIRASAGSSGGPPPMRYFSAHAPPQARVGQAMSMADIMKSGDLSF